MKKLLLVTAFLTGCSTSGVERSEQNKGGAVVGVIDELDGNHEDMIAGGIAGALVGGLFTALFEGSDIAYEYKLKSESEGEFTLIQKERIDIQSGCGKVKIGSKATIKEALKINCKPS